MVAVLIAFLQVALNPAPFHRTCAAVLKSDMADNPHPGSPKRNLSGTNTAGKKAPCGSNVAHRSPKQDTYWFAHAGGDTPSEDAAQHGLSPDKLLVGGGVGDLGRHHPQLQMSREERLRMVKERQEEDRARRLQEFQHNSQVAQLFREQQEEERRKRIEELRQRDLERRQQVEERKRLIWEAEHERKEAVLRRSMDRDTKTEARCNANRMSGSFAFGSSTPRTFDLDLATLGTSGAPVLMSATASRRSEERDFEANRKRAASSYNLCQAVEGSCEADKRGTARSPDTAFVSPTSVGWLVGSGVTVGEDPMTRSMIVMSSNGSNIRARRKTDLMPAIPWNRGGGNTPSRSRSPGTSSSAPGGAKRAVSMSRLDALAQPRRRFLLTDVASTTTPSSSMTAKSMLNLASHSPPKMGPNSTSKSMLHLLGGEPRLRQARSMSQLAVLPRQTRSSMLRVSRMSLSPAVAQGQNENQSLSRPRSSMSMASEQSVQSSQASTVSLRPRAPPHKPRPLSIAGTVPDRSLGSTRSSGGADKSGSSSPEKAARARSATSIAPEVPPKPAHLRKPQKPQPPASSPSRREQRSAPKPSRSQPDLVCKSQDVEADVRPIPQAAAEAGDKGLPEAFAKSVMGKPELAGETASQQPTAAKVPEKVPEEVPPVEEGVSVKEGSPAKKNVIAKEGSPPKEGTPEKEGAPARQSSSAKESTPTDQGASVKESALSKEGTPAKERSPEAVPEEGVAYVKAPRVISEDEARALLAEKRRLAREQAEREAELERQRQEELRRQQEECRRQQEEEQRRLEEEQLRLAEEFRKQEEEKLQRAIEEQQKREAEEQQRRELEAQQKAEREEQERKAREEAEKQRQELEERLKREEAERAERKKRVEEIMSRTRRRAAARDSPDQVLKSSSPESDGLSSRDSDMKNGSASTRDEIAVASGTLNASQLSTETEAPGRADDSAPTLAGCSNDADSAAEAVLQQTKTQDPVEAVQEPPSSPSLERKQMEAEASVRESLIEKSKKVQAPTESQQNALQEWVQCEENRVNSSEQIVADKSVEVQRDLIISGSLKQMRENGGEGTPLDGMVPMEQSPQSKPTTPVFSSEEMHRTNGYSSHNHSDSGDRIVNGVSPEKLELGLLRDRPALVVRMPEPTNSTVADEHSVDNLLNVEDINSNRVPTSPLIAFEEDNKNTKAQEPQLTDLLS